MQTFLMLHEHDNIYMYIYITHVLMYLVVVLQSDSLVNTVDRELDK